jgi:AraC-like DNA-binding protein
LSDPLTQVAGLIQPRAPFSKIMSAAGEWRVRRSETGRPFYCAVLQGRSCLAAEGHDAITLEAGDFVLIPAARDFSVSSVPPPATTSDSSHVMLPGGEVRIGDPGNAPDYRALVGYCVLASSDAALLLSLLPKIVHVRGERRLATLVELVGEEARADRPGKEIILAHLLEVLFIEAMRSTAATCAAPGLLRGLADERIAIALRQIHDFPERLWTVDRLARESALSRSAFFERFQRVVGVPPMGYLASWRMALAKDMLRRGSHSIASVAERTGYSSTNTFSTAFKRHSGQTPARYARHDG